MLEFEREPRSTSVKGSREGALYNWLSYKRSVHKGKKKGSVYNTDEEVLNEFGFEGILYKSQQEIKSNKNTRLVCSGEMGDSLTSWLSKKREGYLKIYPSDISIATELGFPNLFDILSNESKSNYMVRKICMWISNHSGNMPSTISDDESEKDLAIFLSNKKQAFKNKNSMKFYESDKIVANSMGFTNLFK